MPSDRFLKTMNSLHRGAMKISGGRIGWTAAKMPVVELTTTGRKSGKKRSVILTSPHQDGDAFLVVASKGGEPTHPAWFLNLRDDPAVEVATKGGERQPMIARILTSEEREGLWSDVTAKYKGYAGYQEKTDREIPLVMLEPPA